MENETKGVGKKRILIVDDDLETREMLKCVLGLDSHEVIEANNGAEAIMIFAQSHFDLVLTDYKMPFFTGSELAVRIRRSAPSKPILMITAHHDELSRPNPVDAIVRKPFSVGTLRAAVTRLLSSAERIAA